MLADRYGLPVSSSSESARAAYVAGADCILSATAGWREHLGRAIGADPSFALAHIALARGLFLDADVKPAREAAVRARELVKAATPREQSHVNAVALALEGKPVDALAATRAHVRAVAARRDGARARDRRLRPDRLQRPAGAGDGALPVAVRARAALRRRLVVPVRARLRRLRERAAGRGVAPDRAEHGRPIPRNAHGAHIKVHVLLRDGRDGAGPRLPRKLDARLRPARGSLHCHLSWHVALYRARAREGRARVGGVPRRRPSGRLMGTADQRRCPMRQRSCGARSSPDGERRPESVAGGRTTTR